MKLQLDFDNKTVTIQENVNMEKFFKAMKALIDDWENWTFKTEVEWKHITYPYPIWYVNPWYTQWRYYDNTWSSGNVTVTDNITIRPNSGGSEFTTTNPDQYIHRNDDSTIGFNVKQMSGIHGLLIS